MKANYKRRQVNKNPKKINRIITYEANGVKLSFCKEDYLSPIRSVGELLDRSIPIVESSDVIGGNISPVK